MKKMKVMLMLAMTALLLTACSGQDNEQNEGTEASNNANNEQGKEQGDSGNAQDGYVFEYQGVTISVDALAAPVIEALGEPASYFEAASCAFEGLDKMYTYNSVQIDTYPAEDGDRISGILFKDDMVETPEGVSLFETKADMIAAYGEDYADENGMIVYSKGDMKLCFILEGDEIVSIEYVSTVLE